MPHTAADGPIRVEAVEDKQGLKTFIEVPWALYRDDPAWTPPLKFERMNLLNEKKNPYFAHARAQFWVGYRGEVPIGRISAQVDDLAHTSHGPGTGHFGMIEAPDDGEIFAALFDTAEGWLKEQGMSRSLGPFNLSVNEECGILVDGFDEPPRILMGHALPYYGQRVEELGYEKAKDLWAYDLDITQEFPENVQKILRRAEAMGSLSLRKLSKKRMDEDLKTIIDIFNDAWRDNWGFIPMTAREIEKTGEDLKPFLREDACYIVDYEGEPAAFMLTIPDINEAIRDLDGKILPFGWTKLLWRLVIKNPSRCRVPLMGVRKKHQGSLAGATMAMLLIETIRKNSVSFGYKRAELSWILDDNVSMQRILELILCRHYKTYRVYEKPLS